MNIKAFFSRKPKFLKEPKHAISLAFEIGGKKFYQFENIFSLPYKRGFAAIEFYSELQTKIDKDYLKAHTQAIDKLFERRTLNVLDTVIKVKELNEQMKERMKWAIDTELSYKLFSVVFFGEDEDPYTYDFQKGLEKIKFWRKHEAIDAFFLRQPIMDLIPFFKESEVMPSNFEEVQMQIKEKHSEKISEILLDEKAKTLKN